MVRRNVLYGASKCAGMRRGAEMVRRNAAMVQRSAARVRWNGDEMAKTSDDRWTKSNYIHKQL